MSMTKTLGGDRLGSGKKLKVELHGYERSTHNMGYLWRSTMAAGTLVPFMTEVALPGDTFEINLDCDIKTHPTIGPLFGSYKVQLDIFQAPIRLYQAQLHNNKLGIGMKMANVKLPIMQLTAFELEPLPEGGDQDNSQINPSSLLSYLNIRGVGTVNGGSAVRDFNAIPMLAYWEIYKNYYANKQEEDGYMIFTQPTDIVAVVNEISIDNSLLSGDLVAPSNITVNGPVKGVITLIAAGTLNFSSIILQTSNGDYSLKDLATNIIQTTTQEYEFTWNYTLTGEVLANSWRYRTGTEIPVEGIQPTPFKLTSIDLMRESILGHVSADAFDVNAAADINSPYIKILDIANGNPYMASQQGLGLKTYQSDMFNNWLNTEMIDGTGGINEITAIDTSGGSFNVDTLNLAKKVYNMLNRIAVSGGTYDDWLDAVYTHERYSKAESPIYHGGLIKELVFQEVISNSESPNNQGGVQPLGTLAGKGTLAKKHKGGHVKIKVDEPSYIMGIISLTPRLDYSQGNKWDIHLKTMDDFHKPALDNIGFQELITEQMAWWDTEWNTLLNKWVQKSAGKQPAWMNYMTNVNQTRGNFAIETNEMFMTLNRRYEKGPNGIKDLTTYIDPSKFNNIFAVTSLDAQNFWAQISVDITARRKMSAKLMPNL